MSAAPAIAYRAASSVRASWPGLRAMQAETDVPVTVKTRIGIDDEHRYEFLRRFVDVLTEAGCRKFIVHARVAILEGLSPKENRSVPPLKYEHVFRLKDDLP